MKPSYLLTAVVIAVAAGSVSGQSPPMPVAAVSVDTAEIIIRPEAARAFPARVQPILMNLCGSCHCRPEHTSGFKLTRVTGEYANTHATSRNLRAAALFVRPDNPAASPILLKAITPHGGARDAAFTGRDHPAFKSLEIWAQWARPAAPAPAPPPTPVAVFQPAPAPAPAVASLPPANPPPATTPPAKPTATPRANPDDPFDPEQFNRTER